MIYKNSRVSFFLALCMMFAGNASASDNIDQKHSPETMLKGVHSMEARKKENPLLNHMQSNGAYIAMAAGTSLGNESLIIDELQLENFKNESHTITGAWFNNSYGLPTLNNSTQRKFNFGNTISGALAVGFNLSDFIRLDIEFNGRYKKPSKDSYSDDRYLGINLDHRGWKMKALEGKQARGIVVDPTISSVGANITSEDADDGYLHFYRADLTGDNDRWANYPKDPKQGGHHIGDHDSSNYWTGPGATGTYTALGHTGWDVSTGKAFYIATDTPEFSLAHPYVADGSNGKKEFTIGTNVQGCLTCALNAPFNVYMGGGIGLTYYKLYKASKLSMSYQIKADIEMDLGNKSVAFVSLKYADVLSKELKNVPLSGWITGDSSNLRNPPPSATMAPGVNFSPTSHNHVPDSYRVPDAWTGGSAAPNYVAAYNSYINNLPTVMNEYKEHYGHTFILEGNEDNQATGSLKFLETSTIDLLFGIKLNI